jgi:hypothetical protein
MLILWKLGLTISAVFMVIHGIDIAVKEARGAYHLWNAPRAKSEDGERDR